MRRLAGERQTLPVGGNGRDYKRVRVSHSIGRCDLQPNLAEWRVGFPEVQPCQCQQRQRGDTGE